jgi:hypothetical protein
LSSHFREDGGTIPHDDLKRTFFLNMSLHPMSHLETFATLKIGHLNIEKIQIGNDNALKRKESFPLELHPFLITQI